MSTTSPYIYSSFHSSLGCNSLSPSMEKLLIPRLLMMSMLLRRRLLFCSNFICPSLMFTSILKYYLPLAPRTVLSPDLSVTFLTSFFQLFVFLMTAEHGSRLSTLHSLVFLSLMTWFIPTALNIMFYLQPRAFFWAPNSNIQLHLGISNWKAHHHLRETGWNGFLDYYILSHWFLSWASDNHPVQARGLRITPDAFLCIIPHIQSSASTDTSSSKMYLKPICLPWPLLSLPLVQFPIMSFWDQCNCPHCITLPVLWSFYNSFFRQSNYFKHKLPPLTPLPINSSMNFHCTWVNPNPLHGHSCFFYLQHSLSPIPIL